MLERKKAIETLLQLGQENFLFGLSWVWKKLTETKKKLPNNNQNNREAELMKKKRILPWYTLHIRYIPFFIKMY